MRLLHRYLRSRLGTVALIIALVLIFAATLAMYRLPLAAALYPAALCLLLALACAALEFLRLRRRHATLEALKPQEADLSDQLPEARDVEAADYREIACLLRESRRSDLARAEANFRATTDYYTLWAHQIKTPISAMRLRLQGQDTAEARELLADLGRIERYVEMALTYLRLEGDGSDYVIRTCDLDGVLRPVFKQFAGEFIRRKLKLDYTPVEASVLTDEKWLAFVVGQVLSNALKYTPEGSISVYLEAPLTLCVKDTGIGIAPEDLPRVFEQSYTGLTGRADRRASGIGLYLCKRVCDRLGHGISIQSTPGRGTLVRINLAQNGFPIE